jgi:3',5'-cyclic AMP phosphodiesterase CpdA
VEYCQSFYWFVTFSSFQDYPHVPFLSLPLSLLDQSSAADETAPDSFSVMCKCWDDVHQYFGLHKNCPLQQSQDDEDEDTLSEFSPSQQIDSTLNRLFSFCSQRNPWIESHDLFSDIHKLLTTDSHMTTEINDYFAALSPSSKLKHDVQILETNEITIVRTFITYALARLHELEESSYLSTPLQVLSQSIDKWSSYARMCT